MAPRPPARTRVIPPAECAEALQATFREAWRRCPGERVEQHYLFAGRPARLRIAGRRLAGEITRAFSHLAASPHQDPRLNLQVWDEQETGVPNPAADMEPDPSTRWQTRGGEFTASADGRFVGFTYRHSFSLLDRARSTLTGCRAGAGHFSRFERSKPFLILLSVWYRDRGLQLVHAGLVGHADTGLLVPGDAGAGKSSFSTACLAAGLEFAGDDFAAVEAVSTRTFCGYSVYGTACLAGDQMAWYPELEGCAETDHYPVENKATLYLAEARPERMTRRVHLAGLVLPAVGDGAVDSTYERIDSGAAYKALVPNTIRYIVPRPDGRGVALMTRLVDALPAYRLTMGTDRAGIARAARELLERLTSR